MAITIANEGTFILDDNNTTLSFSYEEDGLYNRYSIAIDMTNLTVDEKLRLTLTGGPGTHPIHLSYDLRGATLSALLTETVECIENTTITLEATQLRTTVPEGGIAIPYAVYRFNL